MEFKEIHLQIPKIVSDISTVIINDPKSKLSFSFMLENPIFPIFILACGFKLLEVCELLKGEFDWAQSSYAYYMLTNALAHLA